MVLSGVNSILCASNLTPESDEALRTAAVLARSAGAELQVFHAVPPPPVPVPRYLLEKYSSQDLKREWRDKLEDQISRVLGPATDHAIRESRKLIVPHTGPLARTEARHNLLNHGDNPAATGRDVRPAMGEILRD